MTYEFDAIAVEVYNGSWVDISADVKSSPPLEWNRGIMSTKLSNRVGNSGFLTFTLNNSASNSAGLAGYYSPGHTNCWSGWTTGLQVRLSFTFENIKRYKFYGRIQPYGLKVEPGVYGARTVAVNCSDFMWRAQMHELDHLDWQQDKRISDLVRAVNANMPIPPLREEIAAGIESFPDIFDMSYLRTTALAEYNKGALSEFSYIYVKGDTIGGETLVVEDRSTRVLKGVTNLIIPSAECVDVALDEDGFNILDEDGNNVLLEASQAASFDNLMMSGMDLGYGLNLANRINSYVYPRRVSTGVTLYELEKSFEILGSETITDIRVAYRDPANLATQVSGINMITPSSSDGDYSATTDEAGIGADVTASLSLSVVFGTEGAVITAVNSSTDSIWVQTLKLRGDGVYTYNSVMSTRNDSASQGIHGVIPMSLDFKYLSSVPKAQLFSDYILDREASPRVSIESCPMIANVDSMRMMGFLQLEPGEKATFKETQSGIDGAYFINGYSAHILEGKYVKWSPVLSDDPGFRKVYSTIVGTDTYIYNSNPDTNFSYDTLIDVFEGINGLLKFDLSALPATATVLSAHIDLTFIKTYFFSEPMTMNIYRCKRAWVDTQATWNEYSTGNVWGTAGAENTTNDRDATAIGTLTTAWSNSSVEVSLDIALVQAMIDGSFANNGFVLKQSGVSAHEFLFYDFVASTVAYRPKIVIAWAE